MKVQSMETQIKCFKKLVLFRTPPPPKILRTFSRELDPINRLRTILGGNVLKMPIEKQFL